MNIRNTVINTMDLVTDIRVDIKNLGKNVFQNKPIYQKLHLGCGGVKLKGFVNIDIKKSLATDVIGNAIDLNYSDNSIERIESYHLIEHLTPKDFDKAIKEWHRVLKPNGTLIIECPDLEETCKWFLDLPEEKKWVHGMNALYGIRTTSEQCHKDGFTKKRLADILEKNGFNNIVFCTPKSHLTGSPNLRAEAKKND